MILDELLQDQNPWWRDGATRRARDYPVRRDLQPEILERVLRLGDRRATVLLGPRQVGKTVLLLQLADDLLEAGWPPANLTYFDFSDDRITGEMTAREVVEAQPAGLDPNHPRAFLLDEIRSASNWDRWLKQAVDARIGRIVATDSAASLLRDGGRESGQGRWDEARIEGLSFREFERLQVARRANSHERYLALGGFPEHALSDDYPEVRRRLRGDIADRAILRDLSRLGVDVQRIKDLFVYLVQDSGAMLNANNRANDLGADPRSVRDWVRLLSDTFLVVPLEEFSRRAGAALRPKPKIFAADHGLVAAFSPLLPNDDRLRGQVFEAVVYRHLRETAGELGAGLSYFRPEEDLEIDFVVEIEGELTGVEVTSSPRVRPEKLAQLRRSGERLRASRLVLIYGGVLADVAEGVRIAAIQEFLRDPSATIQGGG